MNRYLIIILICNLLLVVICSASVSARVLVHSTLDNLEAIQHSRLLEQKDNKSLPLGIKTTGDGKLLFEDSPLGGAVRLHGNLRNNELLVINSEFIDFSRSGRMDFWIKFNENPHEIKKEFYIFCDSGWPINFQMEVLPYGKGKSNLAVWLGAQGRGLNKQLFVSSGDKFQPRGPWTNVRTGEWHRITLKWWKRDGVNDELQMFLDGVCDKSSMYDITGGLPENQVWSSIHIGGNKYGSYSNDFSIDELWIFDDPNDSPEEYSKANP